MVNQWPLLGDLGSICLPASLDWTKIGDGFSIRELYKAVLNQSCLILRSIERGPILPGKPHPGYPYGF